MNEMMIFEIDQAKVPLLNILYKKQLWIDVSFAVVVDFAEDVKDIIAIDDNSEICINSLLSTYFIKDFGSDNS